MARSIEKVEIKLNTIESMESFPLDDRLFMVLNLANGPSLDVYKEGREAKESEIGTALWMYHQALNKAERQIEKLLDLVKNLDPNDYDLEDYLEEYPDSETNYKLQEVKACLYIAMAKNQEKLISKYINQLHLLQEKGVQDD